VANDPLPSGTEKIAELTAIIQTVRDRVRARYPEPADGNTLPEDPAHPAIRVAIADLLPLVHARDAAQAKIAAIGSVNPRAGGPVNRIIQGVKKTVARALQWFVRDQVTFNRETISALEAVMEALNDHNRALISLAAQTNEQLASVRAELAERVRAGELLAAAAVQPVAQQMDLLKAETLELKDIRKHWIEWRADWERKVATNEIQFLRNAADMQGAFQHRVGLMEANFREGMKGLHTDYLGALDRANLDIQQRLWADLEKIRGDYERLIHNELRIVRQRAFSSAAALPAAALSGPSAALLGPTAAPNFDYGRFAERFRGSEEYVRRNLEFYKPFFAGRTNVIDIGCGRGEFLQTLRELDVPARGIDLSEECVAQCRLKGLSAETADLFEYLAGLPEGEFDGVFSSQVLEHLAPERLPEMIRLCASRLRRGGILAIETPNPECLAIFASHFYLDPTHTRPVPHQLLAFYMEEAGLGLIEVHRLSPAVESIPEVAELPKNFQNRFFGGLDFAILARRL
jgi:2-polyprenyl-3-methyl-5-hydroxy-6-metoxy-1,4-benzoquinol methylase